MNETSDFEKFRDYLFERGLDSSSVKRIFSSITARVGRAVRENDKEMAIPFIRTFVSDDQNKKKCRSVSKDFDSAYLKHISTQNSNTYKPPFMSCLSFRILWVSK